jgi:hypothetical protein
MVGHPTEESVKPKDEPEWVKGAPQVYGPRRQDGDPHHDRRSLADCARTVLLLRLLPPKLFVFLMFILLLFLLSVVIQPPGRSLDQQREKHPHL